MKTNRLPGAIVLPALVFFISSLDIIAQSLVVKKTASGEKDMICHKWNINGSADPAGVFPWAPLSTVNFFKDGNVVFTGGKKVQGAWNYDTTGNDLFIMVNDKVWRFKVSALSNQQMVLENRRPGAAIRNILWRDNE